MTTGGNLTAAAHFNYQWRLELEFAPHTLEEKLRFVQSDAFRKNISGIDVEPREYIARLRSGIPQSEFVKIPFTNRVSN